MKLPFDVDLSRLDGKIGTIELRPNSGLYCTGRGGLVNLAYLVTGTTTVNGKQEKVNARGFITVSSSDWKGFARPDILNVSYNWPDHPQVVAGLTVPSTIAGMPDDLYLVCGTNENENKVGMNSSTDKAIMASVTDWLIKGVFFVNEKLVGWAFGQFF